MSAPVVQMSPLGRVSPLPKASRDQACGSPWECNGIKAGEPGSYVGTGEGLRVFCGSCTTQVLAQIEAPAVAPTAAEAQPERWEMTPPENLVVPPPEQIIDADLAPWDGPLCTCTRGAHTGTGFARDPQTGRWVHTGCGRPALRYQGGQPDDAQPATAAQPIESAVVEVVEDDGPVSTPHHPDPTEIGKSDADRAADAAHAEWVADTAVEDAPAECACARVGARSKFGHDDVGRPIHLNCGGLLREKHRHLAPAPPETANETTDDTGAQTDDADAGHGPDDTSGAGAGAAAGQQAGPADGAAGRGEGRDGGGEGAGEDAHGGDQDRGVPAGPAGHAVGDDPQPAHDAAVEGQPARGVADRLEGAQGGDAGDLGAVREEDRELAARPRQVGPDVEFGDERLPDRFWTKVVIDAETGCWLWTASLRKGYGSYWHERTTDAHLVAWRELVGPVPDGAQLDHQCRTPSCVRPAHLEPVSQQVNILRGEGPSAAHAVQDQCTHGHVFSEANTRYYTRPSGGAVRECRACHRAREGGRDPRAEPVQPGEVGPQALGGLAAFFAQPADEDDVEPAPTSPRPLATFDWSLLADDDQWWGAPVSPVGDSDNYLGEFWIRELVGEVGRRHEVGAAVVALVLEDGRVVAVPR